MVRGRMKPPTRRPPGDDRGTGQPRGWRSILFHLFHRNTVRRSLTRSEPDCSTSLEEFRQRLAQTVAWCVPRADPANPRDCLRDPDLRPRTLEPSYFYAVWSVAMRRWPWTRPDPVARGPVLEGGRLLVYFPDAELTDGAAEVESGGYFDVFNAPPWGTWVAFATDDSGSDASYGNYLIAYVPPVFLEACAAGIEVNPEACIVWLEDADVAFRDLLRRHAPELLWSR